MRLATSLQSTRTQASRVILIAFAVFVLLVISPVLGATTITVMNLNDGGPGSLRRALADAVDGDTVNFNASVMGAITLTTGELVVGKNITIAGPGAADLAVDGNANGRVFHISPGKTVTISGLTIRNGYLSFASLSDGAGICNEHATLTINNCTISGNKADSGGGGIENSGGFALGSATLTINNSTISGNTANFAGGILTVGINGSATVTVTNSTFSGNSASSSHGAIFNNGTGGSASLTIRNCTFSGNSGSQGGGIFNAGDGGSATLHIGNTILKAGASGENIYNFGSGGVVTSDGYNLSSDAGVSNNNSSTGSLNATGDQTNTNPLLGDLQDNGGPTLTHALLVGSPAIDQGKDLSGTGQDQRGRSRPVDRSLANATGGDGSDIGAVEGVSLVVLNNHDSSSGSLRQALADSYDGDVINFDPSLNGQTITLTSAGLVVGKNIDIFGLGANHLTVQRAFGTCSDNAAQCTSTDKSLCRNPATATCNGEPPAFRIFTISSGKTVTISGLTISGGNLGNFGSGGGIYNDHAILTVSYSTLNGNSAPVGGGIYNDGVFGSATLTVTGSTLSGNWARYGAGIYNYGGSGSATVAITNSTLSGNSADNMAGGIYNDHAMLTVSNSTLSGNSAGAGGGIYNDSTGGGSAAVTLINSTLSGNSTDGAGGGGILNTSIAGGNATVTIGSTILKAGTYGENIFTDSATITSQGYNLSSDDASTFLNQPTDQNTTDPMLDPNGLQDHGGPTQTIDLQPGSPALDKGKNFSGSANDQRGAGFNRVVDLPYIDNAGGGDGTDIGALEHSNAAPSSTADGYSTDEDTLLTVAAPGVLGNDSDPDGDDITAILVSSPSHAATFALNADGSFTYKPVANYNTTDSFTYKARDSYGAESSPVTVTITINPVNDPPAAADDSYASNINQPLQVPAPGVLGNDSDVDGDPITAVLTSGPSHASSFTLNSDGSFSYTPTLNFSGKDVFRYKARDSHNANSSVATVTITVNPTAHPGTANGSGTIFTHNNQASFNFTVSNMGGVPSGNLSYNDTKGGTKLTSTAITAVSLVGTQVTFSGKGTLPGSKPNKPIPVSFTAVAVDNGTPGAPKDTFTIQISSPYSANGNLTSGNIVVH